MQSAMNNRVLVGCLLSTITVCGATGIGRAQAQGKDDGDAPSLPSLRTPEPPPDDPAPLLERFPEGLTTQEVAVLLADGNDDPDRAAAERALQELTAGGEAVRVPVANDALWVAPSA